jgi:hypothetical protein
VRFQVKQLKEKKDAACKNCLQLKNVYRRPKKVFNWKCLHPKEAYNWKNVAY